MIEENKIPSLREMFKPPETKDWFEAVERLLKGKPYEKIMLTPTYEDIELKPIYTLEDYKSLEEIRGLPGLPPFLRGGKATNYQVKPWLTAQEIESTSLKEINRILKHELKNGQNAIRISLDRASREALDSDQAAPEHVFNKGIALSTLEDLETLFAGIPLQQWPVQIDAGSAGIYAAAFLLALARKQGVDLNALNVFILSDPLADWIRNGTLPVRLSRIMDEMAILTKWTVTHAQHFKTIGIDTNPYHNAGANAVQELAAGLASGVTYIRELLNRGLTIDQVAPRMVWSLGLGPHFFMEIAKIRAARLLWNRVVEAWGGEASIRRITIHGRISME